MEEEGKEERGEGGEGRGKEGEEEFEGMGRGRRERQSRIGGRTIGGRKNKENIGLNSVRDCKFTNE